MKVLKFGGSSVADALNIKRVGQILQDANHSGDVVVVSALGGVTDSLIEAASLAANGHQSYHAILSGIEKRHLDTVQSLLPLQSQSGCLSMIKQNFNDLEDVLAGVFRLGELSLRVKDLILSFGEMLSSKIIHAYLSSLKMKVSWVDSRLTIRTNSHYGYAAVDFETTAKLMVENILFGAYDIFIAPGFIGGDIEGYTTTLGRGGSDYSAAIYAASLNAASLEIWTDVTGIMTADPRVVANARTIPHTSYREAMELSHFGAKVIFPPTIQPVMVKNIPIWVKNTFAPNETGTLITQEPDTKRKGEIITGITSINDVALLSLEGSGMVGVPGFSKRLFEALASVFVNVILITQGSSEHSICVAVNGKDAEKAALAVNEAFGPEIQSHKVGLVIPETKQAIIALVGDKMQSHPGISGRMFSALGRNGINIRVIAQGSSERNISVVVANANVKKGINVLHEAFFETTHKQLNVFIIGTGNVGSKLIGQIDSQKTYLLEQLNLQVRIIGIANSRKMLFSDNGNELDLKTWQTSLYEGTPMDQAVYIETILSKNLRNSVVVDVTANESVANIYHHFLSKSISVVACNKIAAASPYANYLKLKSLAREYNALYLFETNVGASLPIIGTLNDLVKSGDEIYKIQAVLSGTLNFVFNNYNGTRLFADVVRQAQIEGYTEPDPRLDLGGTDVMRKIMILARESGECLEMEDIINHKFLPESCFEGTVEDFYAEMARCEPHFKALYAAAEKDKCKLKFVAQFENGVASVGLRHISESSDLYHLYGKDNVVLFYTRRYPEQPLVVKGAGAGADVTASGVFADIMRVAR